MNLSEMKKLVGQKRFLVPLLKYKLYFEVDIVEVKREFGHILTKIAPHNIKKTFDFDNPKDTKDFLNFAWVRLNTLYSYRPVPTKKDKVDS